MLTEEKRPEKGDEKKHLPKDWYIRK